MKKRNLLLIAVIFSSVQLSLAQLPTVWGTASGGGAYNEGTIFSMSTDGSNFTIQHNFDWPDGFVPMGNLFQASDGNLYGTCEEGGDSGSCTIYQFKPSTGEYTDVYNFGVMWGDWPTSGVVEKDGILYGNSSSGGFMGGGVIYSYNISTGIYTDLYNLPSGSAPNSAPTFASNGILYGTNVYGGATSGGSVYSYDPSTGTYTDVHDFMGQTGFNPYASLLSCSDGKLYGTTTYGGTYGKGIIFSIDPTDNSYTELYEFDGTAGFRPKSALTEGNDGSLYGETTMGGANNNGVIFKFDLTDNTCTKLYDFTTSDGTTPLGNLMKSGTYLSGTTSAGGANGLGTAFYYDIAAGTFAKTVDFNGTNGAAPNCGFITISDEVATGIQPGSKNHFVVYPNPVISYAVCTLSSSANSFVTVKVSDETGKLIRTQNLQAKNSEVQIDLSDLSSGAYFLEVTNGNEKESAKIMKQ